MDWVCIGFGLGLFGFVWFCSLSPRLRKIFDFGGFEIGFDWLCIGFAFFVDFGVEIGVTAFRFKS